MIAVMATGYDAINVSAARQKGITVCNVPEYASYAVAEYFLALVLALAKKLFKGALIMKERRWHHPAEYVGISLKGKILGLFGFGNIARKIVPIAEAVGMNVISNTRCPEKYREQYRNVSFVTFEELLRESDILGLAAPVTPETHGIFNKRAFEMMKSTAFFINTARGALVNEEDLAWALNNELIDGAALDVFQEEPPKTDNPLLSAKNIILTPHSAWAVAETVEALWEGTVGNVEAFVGGKLTNEVFFLTEN